MFYIKYYFQQNNEANASEFTQSYYFKEGYRKYQNFYKKWCLYITFEEESHPWDQFKKEKWNR